MKYFIDLLYLLSYKDSKDFLANPFVFHEVYLFIGVFPG